MLTDGLHRPSGRIFDTWYKTVKDPSALWQKQPMEAEDIGQNRPTTRHRGAITLQVTGPCMRSRVLARCSPTQLRAVSRAGYLTSCPAHRCWHCLSAPPLGAKSNRAVGAGQERLLIKTAIRLRTPMPAWSRPMEYLFFSVRHQSQVENR